MLKKLIPIVVLTGLILFFFRSILLAPDMALAGSDFREIHYPLMKFVVDSIRQDGVIPLWNPHQFLGYSVVGNPQYGLFYPPNWVLLLFSGDSIRWGISLLVVLHILWSGIGMLLLARLWGAAWWPAALAGFVFACGGFPVARIYAGHYALILAMSWVPWILAGAHLAISRKHTVWALPGGLALAFGILAGHPQMILIAGVGVGLQWIYYLWKNRGFQAWWQYTRPLLILGITGLLLSAVAWLPALDYSSKTARTNQSDTLTFANQHALPPEQTAGLLIPHISGSPESEAGYFGDPFYEEMTAYTGGLAIILTFMALYLARGEHRLVVPLLLVIIGILFSPGHDAIAYWLFNVLLPPTRNFRAPGRFLLLTSIGLAGCLALVLTRLQSLDSNEIKNLKAMQAGILVFAISLGLWGAILASHADITVQFRGEQMIYAALLLGVYTIFLLIYLTIKNQQRAVWIIGAVVVIAVLDVWMVSAPLVQTEDVQLSPVWHDVDAMIPEDDYGRILQMSPIGIPNGASWTGLFTPQGYDPISPASWEELNQAGEDSIGNPHSAVNRIYGVKYAIAALELREYYIGSEDVYILLGQPHGIYFYENPYALPRAYLVEGYTVESDLARSRELIVANEFYQGETVLLEESPDCMVESGGGSVTIIQYSPNEVEIQVAAEADSLLILGDLYDTDWQVYVDGVEQPMHRANTVVRAVCVPAGAHTVKFVYRPAMWQIGAGISAVTWLIMLLGGAGYYLRKFRETAF